MTYHLQLVMFFSSARGKSSPVFFSLVNMPNCFYHCNDLHTLYCYFNILSYVSSSIKYMINLQWNWNIVAFIAISERISSLHFICFRIWNFELSNKLHLNQNGYVRFSIGLKSIWLYPAISKFNLFWLSVSSILYL